MSTNVPLPSGFLLRRRLLRIGGASLFASVLYSPLGALAQQVAHAMPGVAAKMGGHKPTYLPAADGDAVAHSVAENLFWNEQLMEHGVFLDMLLPGPELAAQRAEAGKFKTLFEQRLATTHTAKLDKSGVAAFNQSSIDGAKRFADWKRTLAEQQRSGKIRSLLWPTFLDHIAREADYFAARLTAIGKGDIAVRKSEAVPFWSEIMGEHAAFVEHLLDPAEAALIKKARETSEAFKPLRAPADGAKALATTEALVEFKETAVEGIDAGKIKSIIHPSLADHVRREGLKAADELRRAT
jgi:hypothetical protein